MILLELQDNMQMYWATWPAKNLRQLTHSVFFLTLLERITPSLSTRTQFESTRLEYIRIWPQESGSVRSGGNCEYDYGLPFRSPIRNTDEQQRKKHSHPIAMAYTQGFIIQDAQDLLLLRMVESWEHVVTTLPSCERGKAVRCLSSKLDTSLIFKSKELNWSAGKRPS